MRLLSAVKVIGGVGLVAIVIAAAVGGYFLLVNKQQQVTLGLVQNGVSKTAQDVISISQVDRTVLLLQFSEEVLSQSIRNYAETGDQKWRARYDLALPRFDRAVQELRDANQTSQRPELTSLIQSSERLAVIIKGAMNLVDAGQKTEAVALLDDSQYAGEKHIFENNLNDYTNNRNQQVTTILGSYDSATAQVQEAIKEITYLAGALVVLAALAILFMAVAVLKIKKSGWSQITADLTQFVQGGFTKPLEPAAGKDAQAVVEQVSQMADKVVNAKGQADALLAASQEPLIIVDEEGIVHSANDAAQKLFELSGEKIVGQQLDEIGSLLQTSPQ